MTSPDHPISSNKPLTSVAARRPKSPRAAGSGHHATRAILLACMLGALLAHVPPGGARGAVGSMGRAYRAAGQVAGAAQVIVPQGDFAWVGLGPRVGVIDVSNVEDPRLLGLSPVLPGVVSDLAIQGERGVLVTAAGSVHVLDLSDRSTPRILQEVTLPGPATDVVLHAGHAYVRYLLGPEEPPVPPPAAVAVVAPFEAGGPGLLDTNLLPPGQNAYDLAVAAGALAISVTRERHAEVPLRDAALRVYGLEDPATPRFLVERKHRAWMRLASGSDRRGDDGAVSSAGSATSRLLHGVGDTYMVLDLSRPDAPELVADGATALGLSAHQLRDLRTAVTMQGSLYVTQRGGGIGRVSPSPVPAGTPPISMDTALPGVFAGGFAALGRRLIVSFQDGRIGTIVPTQPEALVGVVERPGSVTGVALMGADERWLVGGGTSGRAVFDRTGDAWSPTVAFTHHDSRCREGLRADGKTLVERYCGDGAEYAAQTLDSLLRPEARAPIAYVGSRRKRPPGGYDVADERLALLDLAIPNSPRDPDKQWLRLYDLVDPDNPVPLSEVELEGEAIDVALEGELAVAVRYHGIPLVFFNEAVNMALDVVDTSRPEELRQIGRIQELGGEPGYAWWLPIVDTWRDKAYVVVPIGPSEPVAEQRFKLIVVDLSVPQLPVERGSMELPGVPVGIVASREHALIDLSCHQEGDACGVLVVSLVDPEQPEVIGHLPHDGGVRVSRDGVVVGPDNNVYVAAGDLGILTYLPPLGPAPPTVTPRATRTPTATPTELATPGRPWPDHVLALPWLRARPSTISPIRPSLHPLCRPAVPQQ